MTELKTLKDLEEGKYMFKGLVQLRHVRDEAIKWVKEDFGVLVAVKPEQVIRKWMERLDITEEDLK